jgi:predicted ATPase
MQLGVEHGLRATEVAFLDRALPDSITFHRVFRPNPNEILSECFHHRYASVFILDRLPVQGSSPLGPEDDAAAGFLDEWLASDYGSLGYRIVRVPVLSPKERLAFVLERLS